MYKLIVVCQFPLAAFAEVFPIGVGGMVFGVHISVDFHFGMDRNDYLGFPLGSSAVVALHTEVGIITASVPVVLIYLDCDSHCCALSLSPHVHDN